jgi:hypothetical protein
MISSNHKRTYLAVLAHLYPKRGVKDFAVCERNFINAPLDS